MYAPSANPITPNVAGPIPVARTNLGKKQAGNSKLPEKRGRTKFDLLMLLSLAERKIWISNQNFKPFNSNF